MRNEPSQLNQGTRGAPRRMVYNANYQASLPGELVRSEGQPPVQDMTVNEVYDHLGLTYRFFWENYGRDSIDDRGMQLLATIHYQKNYSNAFWTGKELVIGDGDGKVFNRFSFVTDVIAKEVSKGLVEIDTGLSYWSDDGALIESISDVFGALVKQYLFQQTAADADWLIGQGLFTSAVNGVALRSLKAPGTAYDDPVVGKDPQPAHMKDYVNTSSDNGGVHINSGITNHAFYVIASQLGGHSWEKAGRIWYLTMKDKLRKSSGFHSFAAMTYATAGDLFGSNSTEQLAVKAGWDAVGIDVSGETKETKRKGFFRSLLDRSKRQKRS